MILLGTVDDVFHISGRGSVVSLDFSEFLDPILRFRAGDEIQLRARDGFVVQTKIRGIEHLKPIMRRKTVNIGLLLPSDVNHEHLSKGMEIWLVRDEA
jgi:hypothetical protein